jgi:exodeoxyribonuclease VII small subunit
VTPKPSDPSALPPSSPSPRRRQPAATGFEEALTQLEAIIDKIESGQVGLEQSIIEYERGVALIKRCRDILKGAELKVEELTEQMKADQAAASIAATASGERDPMAGLGGEEDHSDDEGDEENSG